MRAGPLLGVVLLTSIALAGCTQPVDTAKARSTWREGFRRMASLDGVDRLAMDQIFRLDGQTIAEARITVDLPGDLVLIEQDSRVSRGRTIHTVAGTQGSRYIPFDLDDPGADPRLKRDHVPDHRPTGGSNLSRLLGEAAATIGFADLDRIVRNTQAEVQEQWADAATIHEFGEGSWRDRPVWRINFTFENETVRADGVNLVSRDTRRIVHARSRTQVNASGPRAPATLEMRVTFRYGDEVETSFPDAEPAPARIDLDDDATVNWSTTQNGSETTYRVHATIGPTFDEEVPLAEVEMRVGNGSGPDRARLNLADGHRRSSNVTLVFEDAGDDGLLSSGDRLVVSTTNTTVACTNESLLYDTWGGGAMSNRTLPLVDPDRRSGVCD